MIIKESKILKNILNQSWPILISQIAGISYGLLDTIMSGHTSKKDLAVVALSTSIYITIFVSLLGVINSLIPIIANNYGRKNFHEVGRYWSQGVWLSIALSIFGSILLYYPNVWFVFFKNMENEIYERVSIYLKILIFALPASLIFRTIYNLCAALSKSRMMVIVSILSIIFKAFLNLILIFGYKLIPAMGATGAAISTTIVSWITLSTGFYIIKKDKFYKKFKLSIYKPQWHKIKELLKIGLPMGGSYLVEVLTFTSMAILIANEGLIAIGGHQIIANIAGVCYIFPISLGIATSSITAQAIGSGDYITAKKSGSIGLWITIILSFIVAIIIYSNTNYIMNIYTNDEAIKYTIYNLMILLPFFHIVDSIQCFNSYLLRAYKISTLPFITQTIALGVIGLGGGWWFGFGKGIEHFKTVHFIIAPNSYIGASSLWIMSTIGLSISSFFLYILYKKHITKFT
ncbi:MATE family multidrug resistance protein [Candidatus Kinetoplastibacterium desouzaii TCC079E]|uniref:Multidrug-efflux transporter n=1 Tax=Candidatus Kinetoplastidibacterium desouzai TCC079E TaxID=1208919 RepID=M1LML1_9PROT|nr:MATE family efflux transporter [Candidatus Kinetoplastibacterium desouzaii]AGF46967.1 MATE family multidrug resistance protein [Candidatus Kinetoplastibacterium desouzaii TCC079E]